MGKKHDKFMKKFVEERLNLCSPKMHTLEESKGENMHWTYGVEYPFHYYGERGYIDYYEFSHSEHTMPKLSIYEFKTSIDDFKDIGNLIRQIQKYMEFFPKSKFSGIKELMIEFKLVIPKDFKIIKRISENIALFGTLATLIIVVYDENEHCHRYEYHPFMALDLPCYGKIREGYYKMVLKDKFGVEIKENSDAFYTYVTKDLSGELRKKTKK